VVQNKIHWATHGHTAAEIVAARANAGKPNMGLTSWTGSKPTLADVEIAKNYLTPDELDELNRIVSIYLDFAELQALNRKPMYMKNWIAILDEFLRISDRNILTHAGGISHEEAAEKARAEYEKYHALHAGETSPVEQHFVKAVNEVKALEKIKKPRKKTNRGPLIRLWEVSCLCNSLSIDETIDKDEKAPGGAPWTPWTGRLA
jgi:hypothetical protein